MTAHAKNRLLITGDALFVRRNRFLAKALGAHFDQVDSMVMDPVYKSRLWKKFLLGLFSLRQTLGFAKNKDFYKNAEMFVLRSKRLEQQISRLSEPPSYVLHLMGMCAPFWNRQDIPYGMLLDFTMHMAERLYKPWSIHEWREWSLCEKQAYARASHFFVAGNDVAASLMQEYDVPAEKITVIGYPGTFAEVYTGPKTFGSHQLMFYNFEFHRKGGDILLETFAKIRQAIPTATLQVVGDRLPEPLPPGVHCTGWVSMEQMQSLFLSTDLIIAPARCEPFGSFMIEAMNYGVPCIASAREGNGIADFLEEGIDGYLMRECTPERLAPLAIDLLRHPERLAEMSPHARRKVQQELTNERMAEKIWQAVQPVNKMVTNSIN